jgi:hypothetical protein
MNTPVMESLSPELETSGTVQPSTRDAVAVPVGLVRESLVVVAQPLVADLYGVGRILEDGDTLELAVAPVQSRDSAEPRIEWCRLGNPGSMARHALEAPHVLVCSHAVTDQQAPFADRFLRELNVATSLTMPIKHRGEPIGLMALYWTSPREFPQRDVNLFKAVATALKPLIEIGDPMKESPILEGTERAWPSAVDECPLTPPYSENDPGRERRSAARRPFRYMQRITYANHEPGSSATRSSMNVECLDISAGGMSFFLDRLPEFKELVVELGASQGIRFLKARVARVQKAALGNRLGYVVGCRFIGRVDA